MIQEKGLPSFNLLSSQYRDLAQPLRYLLAFYHFQFTQQHYSSKAQLKQKTKDMKLFIPAPIIVLSTKQIKLTHPQAACSYLLKLNDPKHLLGYSMRQQVYIQNLIAVVHDLYMYTQSQLKKMHFDPDHPIQISQNQNFKLKELFQIIQKNGRFLKQLSIADFYFYQFIKFGSKVFGQQKFKGMKEYVERVQTQITQNYNKKLGDKAVKNFNFKQQTNLSAQKLFQKVVQQEIQQSKEDSSAIKQIQDSANLNVYKPTTVDEQAKK